MFCSNCGSKRTSGQFCGNCGNAFEETLEVELIRDSSKNLPIQNATLTPALSATEVSLPLKPPKALEELLPYSAPKVSFKLAVKSFFKGYIVWNARSTRAEYWWPLLLFALVSLGTISIDLVATAGALTSIWYLVVIFGYIALNVRRLHDLGWSGWFFWIGVIPILGLVIAIPLAFFKSKPYEVRWNRSIPKELTSGNVT